MFKSFFVIFILYISLYAETYKEAAARSGSILNAVTNIETLQKGNTYSIKWNIISYLDIYSSIALDLPGLKQFTVEGERLSRTRSSYRIGDVYSYSHQFIATVEIPEFSDVGDANVGFFTYLKNDSQKKRMFALIPADIVKRPYGNQAKQFKISIIEPKIDMCTFSKSEENLARSLFNINSNKTLDNPGYVTYGYLKSPYNHVGLAVHAGLDFRSKNGENAGGHYVYSVVSGKVVKAENGTGYGHVGIQRKDNNNKTILFSYAHLKSTSLKIGDSIKVGDIIGKTGKMGTKDPHLHIEYRTNYTSTYLLGGKSCGSDEKCNKIEIESKTNNPIDIFDLECN